MSEYAETLQNLTADLRIGLSLCTRLPVGPSEPVGEGDVARASWTFPIAGLVVAGFPSISADELMQAQAVGLTGDYVSAMRSAGIRGDLDESMS